MKIKTPNYAGLLMLPLLVIIGSYSGGWWNFLTPVCCFLLLPIYEYYAGEKNKASLHPDKEGSGKDTEGYLLFVPVLICLTFYFTWQVHSKVYSAAEYIGLFISVGYVNGAIGFTLAHELLHRHSFKEKTAGSILLFINNYLHYGIEHTYGHHVYACTEYDPHTAKRGESFYRFLPNVVFRTWINSFLLYEERGNKKEKYIPVVQNRIVSYFFIQLCAWVIIWLTLGFASISFFLLQSLVAIIILHQIDYLQHYGLKRKKYADGKFEKMTAHHAWSTAYPCEKINLFNLEHHAHHHMHPARSYTLLKKEKESPEMPGNYAGMMLLSLVPPLWFRIIHKRIPIH